MFNCSKPRILQRRLAPSLVCSLRFFNLTSFSLCAIDGAKPARPMNPLQGVRPIVSIVMLLENLAAARRTVSRMALPTTQARRIGSGCRTESEAVLVARIAQLKAAVVTCLPSQSNITLVALTRLQTRFADGGSSHFLLQSRTTEGLSGPG